MPTPTANACATSSSDFWQKLAIVGISIISLFAFAVLLVFVRVVQNNVKTAVTPVTAFNGAGPPEKMRLRSWSGPNNFVVLQ